MASNQELACVYAAMALQDDEVPITAEKIQAIVAAAGVVIEPFWASLYAKALNNVDVKTLISNVGSGVGSGAPAAAAAPSAPAAATADPAKEEKKKEEPKEESEDEDMGFGLFD